MARVSDSLIGPNTVPSRVAHNTLLNVLGLAVPLLLAFFVMPIAARHLGPARFGLLGLAWAFTEYLILFDLGLGRAIVRFVAQALDERADDLNEIISLAAVTQVIGGVMGGLAFALAAPAIIHFVFDMPDAIAAEATGAFRVVGISLPVILLFSLLRGVLEGAQRFDLSNAIKMASGTASVVIPAIGAVHGASITTILSWILFSRVVACALYLFAVHTALPRFRLSAPRRWARLRELLSYGKWVLISNVVSPLLVYFDRFALGAIAGVTAVGFYTAPYEGVTRLLLIAVSLGGSLLPALTSLRSHGDPRRINELNSSSIRALMVVMAPPLALVFAFAPELLYVWLGPAYAQQASPALRVLAIGVFANAVAQLPLVSLYAIDRPDVPAKFHLAELIVHVPFTILLIRNFGITGAAIAWSTRVTIDLCLLMTASLRYNRDPVAPSIVGQLVRTLASISALVGALWGARMLLETSTATALAVALAAVAGFLILSWRWVLESQDRLAFRGLLSGSGGNSRALDVSG